MNKIAISAYISQNMVCSKVSRFYFSAIKWTLNSIIFIRATPANLGVGNLLIINNI